MSVVDFENYNLLFYVLLPIKLNKSGTPFSEKQECRQAKTATTRHWRHNWFSQKTPNPGFAQILVVTLSHKNANTQLMRRCHMLPCEGYHCEQHQHTKQDTANHFHNLGGHVALNANSWSLHSDKN